MAATVLKRLLAYPHGAVFDKSPDADLALRVRHPDGAVWSVADNALTVQAGDASPITYSLADYTVAELALAMEFDGFEVPHVSDAWAGKSALCLVEGGGDTDKLMAFRSLLWAIYSSYAGEVRDARHQVGQALRQMVITQAEGEWLDVWGGLYGVPREHGEVDTHLAQRIPQEAFRVRVNRYGIERAILDATGKNVQINEPWKEVFRLDESALSGTHRFYDGDLYGYHLIAPTSDEEVDWNAVLPIIERNKAAGVIVIRPLSRHLSYLDTDVDREIHAGLSRLGGAFTRYQDKPLLDFSIILSDNSDAVLNYESRYNHREVMHSSFVTAASMTWVHYPWGQDSWATASYVVYRSNSRDARAYSYIIYNAQTWDRPTGWLAGEGGAGEFLITEDGHQLLFENGDEIARDVAAKNTWASVGPVIYSAHTALA